MKQTVLFIFISFGLVNSILEKSSKRNHELDERRNLIDTDYVYDVGKRAMKFDFESEQLHNMLHIEELIECYKKHGLDSGNLPNIEGVSDVEKIAIFNSCNPIFNIPIIALKQRNFLKNEENRAWHQEKRSLSRSSHTKTKSMIKDTSVYPPSSVLTQPGGSAASPIEVLVSFDGIDIVKEVLRLQFLFMNTFFSSLSGCIESEVIQLSMCLLDSFSTAFSVLAIELGQN